MRVLSPSSPIVLAPPIPQRVPSAERDRAPRSTPPAMHGSGESMT